MKTKNNLFINLNSKSWRTKLCNILFIKDFNNGKNPLFSISLFYNIILQLICLCGFVPMIYSFFISGYEEYASIANFYFSLLFILILYVIDYFLRFLVIDLHYNTRSYKQALKKQLLSFCSNYQISTVIIIYCLISIYGTYINGGIYFNNQSFSNDIAMIVFSILILINISQIFPRFIFSTVDIKNYDITKKIIYSRRKSIIFTLLAMFFVWLLFSFIVFKVEQNYYSSVPASEIPSDAITNIGNAMYFTFITMTTVGFGDFVPHGDATKIVVVFLAIFGVCFYAYVGSIFVNIYVEYVNRKKSIRNAIYNNKWSEIKNNELLNSINKLMIDNLYKCNLISKQKYQKLLNEINNDSIINNEEVNDLVDLKDISINNNKLFLNNDQLGKRIFDHKTIQLEQKIDKIAIFDKAKKYKFNQMLYFLPNMFIKKIYRTNSLPVIFSKKTDSFMGIKKIIFFSKKPIAEAIMSVNIAGHVEIDKEMAWNMFGKFSLITQSTFNALFKNQQKICVLFIKDFLFFDEKISLEKFAINTNWKIDNTLYLI